MKKTDLATEFPLDTNLVHLNHAGVGPWPRSTQEIICQFAQENMLHGSSNYRQWERTESELRTLAAQLINAPGPDNIALLKNTSEALSLVAYGLNWDPGDEVIIPAGEFPSNRIVWESLTERYGVTVTIISQETAGSLEEAIINATSEKTRLISVSSVGYASLSLLAGYLVRQGTEIIFKLSAGMFLLISLFNLFTMPGKPVTACHLL